MVIYGYRNSTACIFKNIGDIMRIAEIAEVLSAKILTTSIDLDQEVDNACGSDMMSDVLAYVKNQAVLLTGLNNLQVIRTAQMMDMICVVFVRGKIPSEQLVEMAEENSIVVMSTKETMFTACGLLFSKGLKEALDE